MKTRAGFVSNSSSSSFCIYGAFISEEDIDKFKPKDEDVFEWAEGLANEDPVLEVHSQDYDWGIYIGRSWSTVRDNETGLQFKQSVESAVESLLGEKLNCSTCSEAWYDG